MLKLGCLIISHTKVLKVYFCKYTNYLLFLSLSTYFYSLFPLLYENYHPDFPRSYPQLRAFPTWFPTFVSLFPPSPSFPSWFLAFPSLPSFCSPISYCGFYSYPIDILIYSKENAVSDIKVEQCWFNLNYALWSKILIMGWKKCACTKQMVKIW